MITGISATTEVPNIEHMSVLCQEVEGEGPKFLVHLFREELTTEEQAIYDAAINLVGDFYRNKILNTTSFMEVSRMTSTVLQEGEEVKDFLVDYTAQEQDELRDFLAMVISKKDD